MAPLRLAFAGTPDFAAGHLRTLLDAGVEPVAVLTQPDRRAGRGKQARPSPVKMVAEAAGIAVLQPSTLRGADTVEALRQLQLDVLIVVAYGLILPQNVLDLPRFGCINVHGSLLPRWRGAAPIQRAVEAGDAESGVTIMLMDAGLDTGPVLAMRTCPIAPLATSADLYAQLSTLGPALLLEVLAELPTAIEGARDQKEEGATYARKIDKSEAQLDWSAPASELARRIRAFNPAPGCFSFLSEQRIKLWMARPLPATGSAPQGTILEVSEQGISVRCGDGALLLERLQLPGAKAMDASAILRGNANLFEPGQRFAGAEAS